MSARTSAPRGKRRTSERAARRCPRASSSGAACLRDLGQLAEVMRDRALLRRAPGLLEFAEHLDRARPVLFLLVDAHQLAHRRHAVCARRRQRLEDLLGAVEHAGLQVVLRKRETRLFALRRLERLARRDVLVDLDRAVHLAAAPIQAAEREMRLDRVAVEFGRAQERLERAVRLLVDQEIHAGEVIAAQPLLADRARPRLAGRVEADGPAEEQDSEQDPDRFRIHGSPAARAAATGRLVADRVRLSRIDPLAQILARLEMRNVLAGERDRLAGLRIAALARRTEMQREAAEAADLDALAAGERVAHDLEHLLDRELDVLRGQVLLLGGDDLDQF